MKGPNLFVQYSDDIRREADGRLSIMGVYPGRMFIKPNKKARASRLFVHALLEIPVLLPLDGVEIDILWKDKVIKHTPLPESMAAQVVASRSSDDDDSSTILNFVMELESADFTSEGWLRTVAKVDGEKIDGMPLRITTSTKNDASSGIRTQVTTR